MGGKMSRVCILGDIHSRWDILNQFIEEVKPDIILQCGDFGIFPKFKNKRYNISNLQNRNTKIYFCDGNHSDHQYLKSIQNNEIAPNVFYMKRGSTLILPDGRTVLFMGGANSIDKHLRTPGVDWFSEETISQKDFYNLLSLDTRIDIVISHTCPLEFDMHESFPDGDFSRVALSEILRMYKPDRFFFGHWHNSLKGQHKNTEWTLLDECRNSFWWTVLDEKE